MNYTEKHPGAMMFLLFTFKITDKPFLLFIMISYTHTPL